MSAARDRTVAVVGATGFTGRAVVDRCHREGLYARRISRTPNAAAVDVVAADLSDTASLVEALRGCDAVIHAASYTGGDADRAWTVNQRGTGNLMEAAAREGIREVVYVSTIGVYGEGPFRDRRAEPRPQPVTELSGSRLAAEDLVREAGGLVVRPGFVYGDGDRSFLAGLARIVDALGCVVGGGSALQSVVSVERLAEVLVACVRGPIARELRGAAVNVAESEPRAIAELIGSARDAGYAIGPLDDVGMEEASVRAQRGGLTTRQLDLVSTEHTLATGDFERFG